MERVTGVRLSTPSGEKSIDICCGDLLDLTERLDVMTVSAFRGDYAPVPRTMIHTLGGAGIRVDLLAEKPAADLRQLCGVWLSAPVSGAALPIGRIGCVEMTDLGRGWDGQERSVLDPIRAYFRLLALAAMSGVPTETVGMPVLGAGSQGIPTALVMHPMLSECLRLLRESESVRRIVIFTRRAAQAFEAAKALEGSYQIASQNAPDKTPSAPQSERAMVFISYATEDKNVADNLCAKLEKRGLRVWYAPRNASGDFAASIVGAIRRCTHFVGILSGSSLASPHVLNEVSVACDEQKRGMRFCLLKLDEAELGDAFRYYLSRQHWMDAQCPPLEKRLEEFADQLLAGQGN